MKQLLRNLTFLIGLLAISLNAFADEVSFVYSDFTYATGNNATMNTGRNFPTANQTQWNLYFWGAVKKNATTSQNMAYTNCIGLWNNTGTTKRFLALTKNVQGYVINSITIKFGELTNSDGIAVTSAIKYNIRVSNTAFSTTNGTTAGSTISDEPFTFVSGETKTFDIGADYFSIVNETIYDENSQSAIPIEKITINYSVKSENSDAVDPSWELNTIPATLLVGQTFTPSFKVAPNDEVDVKFEFKYANTKNIEAIDGAYPLNDAGKYYFTATSDAVQGKYNQKTVGPIVIDVYKEVPVASWSDKECTVTIGSDDNIFPQLNFRPDPKGANITYKSSQSSVAVIDDNGNITLKGAGQTTITGFSNATGTYAASNEATYKLSVYSPVTATWSESECTATIGSSDNVFPTLDLNPVQTGAQFSYSSSDPSVAKINEYGVITLLKEGTTEIYGQSVALGYYYASNLASYTLTVLKSDKPTTPIDPETSAAFIFAEDNYGISTSYQDYSSDETVTISSGGVDMVMDPKDAYFQTLCYNDDEKMLQVYGGVKVTFKAPAGKGISSIKFAGEYINTDNFITTTEGSGNDNNVQNSGFSWVAEKPVQSVTFTKESSGSCNFSTIAISLEDIVLLDPELALMAEKNVFTWDNPVKLGDAFSCAEGVGEYLDVTVVPAEGATFTNGSSVYTLAQMQERKDKITKYDSWLYTEEQVGENWTATGRVIGDELTINVPCSGLWTVTITPKANSDYDTSKSVTATMKVVPSFEGFALNWFDADFVNNQVIVSADKDSWYNISNIYLDAYGYLYNYYFLITPNNVQGANYRKVSAADNGYTRYTQKIVKVENADGELVDMIKSNLNLGNASSVSFAIEKNGVSTLDLNSEGNESKGQDFTIDTDTLTSLDTVTVEGEVEYFTLSGVRVTEANLLPGIYIRRQENVVSKVLVK